MVRRLLVMGVSVLAGDLGGGFYFRCLSLVTEPKTLSLLVESRDLRRLPSGSPKATTRDDALSGCYEEGRSKLGKCATLRLSDA